jgi:tetratricopeptide (TPR) repeat protein
MIHQIEPRRLLLIVLLLLFSAPLQAEEEPNLAPIKWKLQVRQPDQALDLLTPMLKKYPGHAEVNMCLVEILELQDKKQEVRDVLDSILGKHPNHLEALLERARYHALDGENQQALKLLNRALAVRPESELGRYLKAVSLVALNRREEAVALYTELIAMATPEGVSRLSFYRGQLLLELGRDNEAAEDFERSLEGVSDRSELLQKIASAYHDNNHNKTALEYFERAEAKGSLKAESYFKRALILTSQKQYEDALVENERALQSGFSHPFAHYNLGFLCSALTLDRKALQAHRKATELEPLNPDFWFGLADAQISLSLWEEAEESLKKVLELSPSPRLLKNVNEYIDHIGASFFPELVVDAIFIGGKCRAAIVTREKNDTQVLELGQQYGDFEVNDITESDLKLKGDVAGKMFERSFKLLDWESQPQQLEQAEETVASVAIYSKLNDSLGLLARGFGQNSVVVPGLENQTSLKATGKSFASLASKLLPNNLTIVENNGVAVVCPSHRGEKFKELKAYWESDQLVSWKYNAADLVYVTKVMAGQVDRDVVIGSDVSGSVTVWAENAPVNLLYSLILESQNAGDRLVEVDENLLAIPPRGREFLLPPGFSKLGGPTLNVDYVHADLRYALARLCEDSEHKALLSPEVRGSVTITTDRPAWQSLQLMLSAQGDSVFQWEVVGNEVRVWHSTNDRENLKHVTSKNWFDE